MFEIKSYTRKELASLYFPGNTPGAAYQNLRRWLAEHTEHASFLERIRNKRILSRMDVQQIVSLLGVP